MADEIVSNPEAQVTSSQSIPDRTPEQVAQGAADAKTRADEAVAKGTLTLPKKEETILPADVAKPKGESKLPDADADGNPIEVKKEEPKKEDAPKVDEKNPHGVPAKYLNDDGTPDYKKLSDAYINSEKMLGKKGFSNVAKADELTYTPGKDALPIAAENLTAFQKKAFEAGMTKEQFAAVMNEYETLFKNQTTANSAFTLPSIKDAAAMTKVKTTLEGIFGKGDDYNDGLNRALKTVENYLPSQFKVSDPVFNHPAVVSLLAAVGKELGEDKVTGSDKSGTTSAGLRSPQEIRSDPAYKGNEAKFDQEIMRWYKAQPGGTRPVSGSQMIRSN